MYLAVPADANGGGIVLVARAPSQVAHRTLDPSLETLITPHSIPPFGVFWKALANQLSGGRAPLLG
jgi:hypothetical protein